MRDSQLIELVSKKLLPMHNNKLSTLVLANYPVHLQISSTYRIGLFFVITRMITKIQRQRLIFILIKKVFIIQIQFSQVND